MSKIHEELPNQSFERPAGIVSATVCRKSGKLAISGICEGNLKSEYFAEGTVPSESCDVHYSGMVCAYSMLPASDECPFKVPGTLEITPGDRNSGQPNTDPATDPLQAGENPLQNAGVKKCEHNAAFYTQPNAEAIVQQQMLEMQLQALQNGTPLPDAAAGAAGGIVTDPITGTGETTTVDGTTPTPPETQPEIPVVPPVQ